MRRHGDGFLERCAAELPIWFISAAVGAGVPASTTVAACVAAGVYLLLTVLSAMRRDKRARQLDEQRDALVSDAPTDTLARH